MKVMQEGNSERVYDFDLDEIVDTSKTEYLRRILKKIQRCVGVGYENIWDKIPYNCETITVKELVDIAEKMREGQDALFEKELTPEEITAFEEYLRESSKNRDDELPF